jgi:hypothetical protein
MSVTSHNLIADGTRVAASEHPKFPGSAQDDTQHRGYHFAYLNCLGAGDIHHIER